MIERVGENKFKKIAWVLIALVSVLTIFFAFQIPNARFNYDFEKFFPANDEESDFFYEHRDRFESDNDFLLIAIENEKGIFETEFLQEVHKFAEEINKLELVKFTRDITHEEELFVYTGGITDARPYIRFQDSLLAKDSINIYENKELVNSLVSEGANSLSIYIRHLDFLSKAKSDRLVDEVKEIQAKYSFDNVRMAGRTVGQKYYVDTMTTEMIFFVGMSMILVVVFLFLAFRSVWGVLLPQVVIVLSLIWIIGFMVMMDEPINILLTILPSIMFVVGMSDVIHLVSKYLELIRLGESKFKAIKVSFREIGLATFLTSITTAIGFFSLILVNVQPIQVFGIYIGIGVLLTFLLTFTMLPILFYFTAVPKIALKDRKSDFWRVQMSKAFLFTMKNRKILAVSFIIVIGVFGFGATKIVTNNYLMDDLKPSAEIKQNFDYLDDEYGGVRPFELAVFLNDTSKTFWSKEVIEELDKVENYLIEDYGVEIKVSFPFLLKIVNRTNHAGNPEQFKVPTKKRDLRNVRLLFRKEERKELLDNLIDSTGNYSRINGTIPDWGNIETTKRNKEFKKFLLENTDSTIVSFQLTGTAHLLDKNMSYMSTSLVQGLLLATAIVAIIMGLLFKSLRMVVISVVPNLIPLIFIAGLMGYMGINLKITTAIIFTISFGIAVDDTIHFLSKFKIELSKGSSKLYALKRTYISTGKAIVLTTLILCSGFLFLIFSDFLGTFYMGLMISLTLLFAVIADIFLLPLLLLYFWKDRKKVN